LLEIIQRTDNFIQGMGGDVCVDLGCLAVAVPQQHLNVTQICSLLQQMGGKGVAQGMGCSFGFASPEQVADAFHRLSPEGKTTLRREVLLQAGFDFRYFTHLYRTQKGNTYYFCYDYLLLEEEKVLIVNW
jgi:hypothetical protein